MEANFPSLLSTFLDEIFMGSAESDVISERNNLTLQVNFLKVKLI